MKKRSGFTVIELAITLVIVGTIMIPAIAAYDLWVKEQKRIITNERVDTIKRAVGVFVTKNRILPCPARQDVAIDSSDFGVSFPCDPSASALAGTTDVAGADGGTIRIGDVPVRTLGLPDEYIGDKWGKRFIYAATRELADTPMEFRNSLGAISLVDNNGHSLIQPPDRVMFIVASTGPDGLGGVETLNGGSPAQACSTAAADGENCDNDNAFSVTSEYSLSNTGNHFDDTLRYELKDFIPISSIKEYQVVDIPCRAPDPHPGLTPNSIGQCASGAFNGPDIYIDPSGSAETPADGLEIYNNSFISKTDGRLIVRATISATVNNDLVAPGGPYWEEAIHAAIYIDGTLQGYTVITDPTEYIDGSQGFTSIVLANDTIVKDATYTIEIYIYSLGNENVTSGTTVMSGWAGTSHHGYHDSTSKIEIMEIQDF